MAIKTLDYFILIDDELEYKNLKKLHVTRLS